MNIREILMISNRNIRRQKIRTIFTVLAIAVGIGVSVFDFSLFRGLYESSINNYINEETGHIQIHSGFYEKEQLRKPVSSDYIVHDIHKLISYIKKLPNIKAIAPYIDFSATILAFNHSIPVTGRGIEPNEISLLDTIPQKMEAGVFFPVDNKINSPNNENPEATVILGYKLAKSLDVKIGDIVRIRAKDSNGMISADTFTVIGTFKAGFDMIDSSTFYMSIAETQRFLQMDDKATFIKIMLNERSQVDDTLAQMKNYLKNLGYEIAPPMDEVINTKTGQLDGDNIVKANTISIESWTYFTKSLIQYSEIANTSFQILGGLIIFLIIFGVMNTMSLSVRQRAKELATFRAIGMYRTEMVSMILLESITLGLMGTFFGIFLGYIISYWLDNYGIPMPKEVLTATIRITGSLKGKTQIIDYILSGSFGLIAGLLGSILPGRFVWKMSVIKGLQGKPDVLTQTNGG